jgi:hypothetical protein
MAKGRSTAWAVRHAWAATAATIKAATLSARPSPQGVIEHEGSEGEQAGGCPDSAESPVTLEGPLQGTARRSGIRTGRSAPGANLE